MNKDILQGKWKQLRGSVQTQWGRLTNDDLDQVEGNGEKLLGLIQEKYGYARDEAERRLNDFVKSTTPPPAHPANSTSS
ncbi:MAG: CsbD family protein [Thermoanaerobaculia bacterium]